MRNGHVYLELSERDNTGQPVAKARGMIWASTATRILPEFEQATGAVIGAGIKLLVRARPVFKAQYGFSLEIDAIDPEYTLGDLEARKKEIRARLQREGVFDSNRQLAPPWDYRLVLVVAPQDAAGLRDFRKEAERLAGFGICRFVYAHSRFQGEGAAREIVMTAIAALRGMGGAASTTTATNEAGGAEGRGKGETPDAIVIIRGGGAVNDLAWLNDYELARFICDQTQPFVLNVHASLPPPLDHSLHARGVPCNHDVGEQGMSTGDCEEFVLTAAALWRQPSRNTVRSSRPSSSAPRRPPSPLASLPHSRNPIFALIRPVRIEAAKRSMPSQPLRTALSATLVLTTGSIACEVSPRAPTGRYVQLAFGQRTQARAQVKAEQLCSCHPGVGVAVGVNSDHGHALLLLTVVVLDTRYGSTGLPFVEHDRLVIHDAVTVQHVGIKPRRIGSTPRVNARIPKVLRGAQRHHVGRRLVTFAPQT